ncbi:MAG: hypothetical protein BroJett040_25750 [Oligoflexia bacterium]|nr:MAG: hypothetical protein BroJett040_25750 [Oligoflexia bacterium]
MKRKRLLVIDDEPEICSIIRTLLEDEVGDVVTAEKTEEALHILNEQKFDLILTDIMMPGMSGTKLLSKINSGDQKTPVIFISGVDAPEYVAQLNSMGAVGYLSKPFMAEELIKSVHQALEGKSFLKAE